MSMHNKCVLITGATSGIGESLFAQYSQQGHQVIACGRNSEKLAKLKASASQTLQFDVNNEQQIAAAAQHLPALDIIILNAGDCRYIDDVMQFDHQLFSEIIHTNLIALATLLKYFLPKLQGGGQLVLVSSSATILPFPRAQAYGASKAGVDYLANSLRLDLAKHHIGVTLVHPGFIKTPLTDKNDFDMPFMLSSEQAAQRIYKGVQAKKKYLHFPKRLTLLLKLFSLLPNTLWQNMMLRNEK